MPQPLSRRRFLEILGASGVTITGILPALAAIGCKDGKDETGGDEDIRYFAVITDTHVHDDPKHINNETLAQTVEILNGYEVPLDFVVITGDLVDDLPSDDPAWYEKRSDTALDRFTALVGGLTVPVYPALGNHDYFTGGGLDNGLTTDFAAREALFLSRLAMPGLWYRVDSNGIAFYVLNSMQPDPRAGFTPSQCGSFGKEQLAWLESQLADGVPSLLFFHHPLALDNAVQAGMAALMAFEVPRAEGGYAKYEGTEYEGWTDPIYEILAARASQILAVFVGHGHWFVRDEYEGIPVMETDSIGNSYQLTEWEGSPMRYHIVGIDLREGTLTIANGDRFTYNA